MAKSLTFILVALMALALMLFTASRTLDLLQLLLPSNQSVFAFLGLVAFDGGLLGWSMFFAYGARGAYQRAIALLMVIISLLAIGISVIADLMISASAKGLVTSLSEQQRLAILLAVGAIVFINVAAFFLTHITDPDRLRHMAVEGARDKIQARTLQLISQKADVHANDMADQLSEQWVSEAYAQLGLSKRTQLPVIAAPVVNAVPIAPAAPAQPIVGAPVQQKRGLWGRLAGQPVPPAQQPAAPVQPPAAPTPPTIQQPAQPQGSPIIIAEDKLGLAIEALTLNPDMPDDDLAVYLDVKRPASARYWKLKAQEALRSQVSPFRSNGGGANNGHSTF
jgi:hypothetical protein